MDFNDYRMSEDQAGHISEEEMIKKGLINVMALGYKGVELWRANREPIKQVENQDEEKA